MVLDFVLEQIQGERVLCACHLVEVDGSKLAT
jgi:hypothetical protein